MIQSSEIHATSIVGDVRISEVIQGADVLLGRIQVVHSDLPDYEGTYEITPSAEEQILNTKNTTMRDDLAIRKIPYFDVANEYGRTIYIGSDING